MGILLKQEALDAKSEKVLFIVPGIESTEGMQEICSKVNVGSDYNLA